MRTLLLTTLILVPVLELYLLIQVGSEIGALAVMGLLLATAAAGLLLLRYQGFSLVRRAQAAVARGELPARELLDGLLVLAAGLLLVFPGFLTDVLALALLLPWLRAAVLRRLAAVRARRQPADEPRRPRVIEGEYRRLEDPRNGDES